MNDDFNVYKWGQAANMSHAHLLVTSPDQVFNQETMYKETVRYYNMLMSHEKRFRQELEQAKVAAEEHLLYLAEKQAEQEMKEH